MCFFSLLATPFHQNHIVQAGLKILLLKIMFNYYDIKNTPEGITDRGLQSLSDI
jgi:hypothetical protein